VFDPFTQGDDTLHRTLGGLGLGLALVKGLVELHGGEVEASSEGIGRGAEIAFELPVVLAESQARDAAVP
jgi:signal transduction histidine kinase